MHWAIAFDLCHPGCQPIRALFAEAMPRIRLPKPAAGTRALIVRDIRGGIRGLGGLKEMLMIIRFGISPSAEIPCIRRCAKHDLAPERDDNQNYKQRTIAIRSESTI